MGKFRQILRELSAHDTIMEGYYSLFILCTYILALFKNSTLFYLITALSSNFSELLGKLEVNMYTPIQRVHLKKINE